MTTHKTIMTRKGEAILVSAEDYDRLSRHKWSVDKDGYAQAKIAGKTYQMHRMITNAPEGALVDHIRGQRLDNRRSELRLASHQQNQMNKRCKAKSGFKGVYLHCSGRWWTKIGMNYRYISLGYYPTPEEAAQVYDAAARHLFGEFAATNFLDVNLAAQRIVQQKLQVNQWALARKVK